MTGKGLRAFHGVECDGFVPGVREVSGEWRERRQKQILRYAQDGTEWNGAGGGAGNDSSGRRRARRT